MSLIDEALRNRIINDAALVALIGTRVHLIRAPQGGAYPCITYQKIDSIPASAYATTARLENARFQFDCWAPSPATAKNIADKLKSSLDGYIGVILGVTIFGVQLANETDIYEEDAEMFRSSLDFKVQHKVN